MNAKEAIFDRGMLTDWLLAALMVPLGEQGILVGDNLAPAEGGWMHGDQGEVNDFIPYVVLTTGSGSPQPPDGIRGYGEDGWLLRYRLGVYGSVRSQVDWAADKVRRAWYSIPRQRVDLGDKWMIYHPTIASMGPISRSDSVSPQAYELVDEAVLSVTR